MPKLFKGVVPCNRCGTPEKPGRMVLEDYEYPLGGHKHLSCVNCGNTVGE
jgi:hypothetical protein